MAVAVAPSLYCQQPAPARPHQHVEPTQALACPRGRPALSHRPAAGAHGAPQGGFEERPSVTGTGQSAHRGFWRAPAAPSTGLGHRRDAGAGRENQSWGDGGAGRSRVLPSHAAAEHRHLVTGVAAKSQPLPLYPCCTGRSAALRWCTAPSQKQFSLTQGKTSLSAKVSTPYEQSTLETALAYTRASTEIFFFAFSSFKICSDGFHFLQSGKALVIISRTDTHYASSHKCESIIDGKVLPNYWTEEYLNKGDFTVTSSLRELQ